jgi:hypothetical protein
VADYYVTVTSDYDLSDNVKVSAAVRDDSCSAAMIQERLQAQLRVRPDVELVTEQQVREHTAPENSRKINRFIDRRRTNP